MRTAKQVEKKWRENERKKELHSVHTHLEKNKKKRKLEKLQGPEWDGWLLISSFFELLAQVSFSLSSHHSLLFLSSLFLDLCFFLFVTQYTVKDISQVSIRLFPLDIPLFLHPFILSLSPSFHSFSFAFSQKSSEVKLFLSGLLFIFFKRARTSQSRALTTISSSMPFDPRREEEKSLFLSPLLSFSPFLPQTSFETFLWILSTLGDSKQSSEERFYWKRRNGKERKAAVTSTQRMKETWRRTGRTTAFMSRLLSYSLLSSFLAWSSILVLTPHLPFIWIRGQLSMEE